VDENTWTAQIDALLAEAAGLHAQAKFDDLSDLGTPIVAVDVRLAAAIQRIAPATAYSQEARRAEDLESWERVPRYVGILTALRADIASGWMESLTEVVHAETFSDVLDQAVELNEKSYKDPAAVVAGAALESHLRLLAAKYGVDTILPAGGPKKADTVNADLVKAGAYPTIQQKSVTAWLGIRNAAAHGEYDKYAESQVRHMIDAVRDFIARTPA
jgi:hypothetical protein